MQMGKEKYNLVGTKTSVRVWLAHASEHWRDKLTVEGTGFAGDSLVYHDGSASLEWYSPASFPRSMTVSQSKCISLHVTNSQGFFIKVLREHTDLSCRMLVHLWDEAPWYTPCSQETLPS